MNEILDKIFSEILGIAVSFTKNGVVWNCELDNHKVLVVSELTNGISGDCETWLVDPIFMMLQMLTSTGAMASTKNVVNLEDSNALDNYDQDSDFLTILPKKFNINNPTSVQTLRDYFATYQRIKIEPIANTTDQHY